MRRCDAFRLRPVFCRTGVFRASLAALLAVAAWDSGVASAQQIVAPPAIYPADTWQGRSVATVRVLDTLDSSVQVLTIPVGQDAAFKALTIHVGACRDRPATLTSDAAGWLAVRDTRQDGPGFNGWMLAGEPFLGVFQDPVYAVRLVGCAGDMVAPVPPPLVALSTEGQPGDQQGAAAQGSDASATGSAGSGPSASGAQKLTGPPAAPASQPMAVPAAPVRAAPLGGAPLSLSPPDESAPEPGTVSQPRVSTPVPAPSAVTGRPLPLPPPVPFGSDGAAAPYRSAPVATAPPASQAQPGQPQSLLPP